MKRGSSERLSRRRDRVAARAGSHAADTVAAPDHRALMLGGVLAVTALVYLRCLANGFVFDDHDMVVANRFIGQWSFLWKSLARDSWWFMDPTRLPASAYYRPLQDIWLGLHYHLFGSDAAGWHATMVALHLIAVWLVFEIAARLTGEQYAAPAAALLFGLMPLHAEAVVWATAIPLPLSGALELAAFYLFIARAGAERRNWPLALLMYGCALISHESAVVFPALIGLYVLLAEPDPAAGRLAARIRAAILGLAPFAAETLAYLILRRLVLGFINRPNALSHLTTAQAIATAPRVVMTYAALLVMPWLAGPAHQVAIVMSTAAPGFYLPLAALVACVAVLFVVVRGDRRGRLYLFCVAWMVVALMPMMNLRGLFEQALVQDRYLYLSSMGWCVIVADCGLRLSRRGETARRLTLSAGVALVALYAGTLWMVQGFWYSDETLSAACIERCPDSAMWRNRLASALEQRGDLAGAERELSTSLSLDPNAPYTLYDLGLLHVRMGRIGQSAGELAAGIGHLPHPTAQNHLLLAQVYDLNRDYAQRDAELNYAESLPGGAEAVGLTRAQMKVAHGDAAGAEAMLRELARQYPGNYLVWTELGRALAAEGRNEEALATYKEAVKITPGASMPHFLSAQLLHAMNRDREALEQCRLVLAAAPNDPTALALMTEIERGAGPH